MGPHFLAFSGKLSVNRQEKNRACSLNTLMQKFRHFQAKNITKKIS